MATRARKTIIALGAVGACVLIGVCVVFAVLAGAAVMGYQAATRAGNEAATLQNVKTIAACEIQFFNTHQRTFGTLEQLRADSGLSSKFSPTPAVADGYVLTLSVIQRQSGSWYKLTADPQRERSGYPSWLDDATGRNHFYLDADSTCIRVNSRVQAGPSDPCFENSHE